MASFKAGVNEVSYKSFREILNQPVKSTLVSGTYLDIINERFGDRSDVSDEMPVTGYPVDVAILYCELAGGRLPSCIEWEYLATMQGTSAYSTGDQPPYKNIADWKVEPVTAVTPDTTPTGIRNLCSNVAEYTDSYRLSYTVLFPQQFPESKRALMPTEEQAQLPRLVEVRGAPQIWIDTGTAAGEFNPRQRLIAAPFVKDNESSQVLGGIGWRMVRGME